MMSRLDANSTCLRSKEAFRCGTSRLLESHHITELRSQREEGLTAGFRVASEGKYTLRPEPRWECRAARVVGRPQPPAEPARGRKRRNAAISDWRGKTSEPYLSTLMLPIIHRDIPPEVRLHPERRSHAEIPVCVWFLCAKNTSQNQAEYLVPTPPTWNCTLRMHLRKKNSPR